MQTSIMLLILYTLKFPFKNSYLNSMTLLLFRRTSPKMYLPYFSQWKLGKRVELLNRDRHRIKLRWWVHNCRSYECKSELSLLQLWHMDVSSWVFCHAIFKRGMKKPSNISPDMNHKWTVISQAVCLFWELWDHLSS